MAAASSRHVVVLGGGVAGLTAAWSLVQAATVPLRVTIVEASDRLGGWLHSERVDGMLFERGCRGIRPVGSGKEAMRLIESLGLQHLTLASSPSAKTRYLWTRGGMKKVPSSLAEAITSPLTRAAPFWGLRDLTAPPRVRNSGVGGVGEEDTDDESLASFASRRFGDNVAHELLDAVMSGIYAGDVNALSAKSVLSGVWNYAESHPSGSVFRGVAAEAMEKRRKRKESGGVAAEEEGNHDSPFVNICAAASSVSFIDGTQTLTDELVRRLRNTPGVTFATRTEALKVERNNGEGDKGGAISVILQPAPQAMGNSSSSKTSTGTASISGKVRADAVISGLPAPALARVLPSSCSEASTALRAIPFASVATICMAWKNKGEGDAKALLPRDGFGYLVPSRERGVKGGKGGEGGPASSSPPGVLPILGMTWDSTVFPGQSQAFASTRRHWRRTVEPGASGYVAPTSVDDVSSPVRMSETRVTVMAGGATWPGIATDLTKEDLLNLGMRAMKEHVGSSSSVLRTPDVCSIHVAEKAIPQYNVGHSERVRRVEGGVEMEFGKGKVVLIGNSLRGVGVSDTVAGALKAGKEVAKGLGLAR